jgi:hypothetical protein
MSTPTPTPTFIPTGTPERTSTPTPTLSANRTSTPTPTLSANRTSTPTPTFIPTGTPESTPTRTPTKTPTPTPTKTPTPTPTPTKTPTPTSTPKPTAIPNTFACPAVSSTLLAWQSSYIPTIISFNYDIKQILNPISGNSYLPISSNYIVAIATYKYNIVAPELNGGTPPPNVGSYCNAQYLLKFIPNGAKYKVYSTGIYSPITAVNTFTKSGSNVTQGAVRINGINYIYAGSGSLFPTLTA